MAELELSVRYKTVPTTVGFYVMCGLMPVWALLAPVLLGLFLGYIFSTNTPLATWATFVICATLLLIFIVGMVLTAIAEDDRLYVSKDGLAFPLFMLPALRFRRNRNWSELREASLIGSATEERLVLTFDQGTAIPVKLADLTVEDREQLMLAIELWGTECKRAVELVDYQSRLQNEIRGLTDLSHTQMWEEELGRRFSATSFVPLEPGAELRDGNLKVEQQLAFGGLSAIYLAQRDETDMVVIKEAVIPENADPAERTAAEERIAREAQFLMRLSHPNIARVLDHFVDNSRHYLMLEYVHGQDLRQLVKQNGARDVEFVQRVAREVAQLISYLHSQDPPIIHRDLTPDNLVLKNDGSVVLIDFGAANEFLGQATGTLVGKQAYMAPEQLRGKAVVQSDLYSFGGTLHFLLTGSDPTPLSVSHPKKTVTSIPDDLDELVARLTGFEVENRPSSASEVLDKLNGIKEPIEGGATASIAHSGDSDE